MASVIGLVLAPFVPTSKAGIVKPTLRDISGHGNDGTLVNMKHPEWEGLMWVWNPRDRWTADFDGHGNMIRYRRLPD